MSHLEKLLMNEIRKPLEQMEKSQVGYIDSEREKAIYYKIDDKFFKIEVKEVDALGKDLE